LHTEKVVRIAPPLVITDDEIEWAIEVMEGVLK
jgi:acetylornithine/succinyldiaminopimelate/putrescine aminotransferase